MPYQSSGGRRNNVQLGVGQSIWAGSPPAAIPERVLDGIPGFLAWLALLICVACAIAFPRALLLVAVSVALYSAVRFTIAAFANIIGLRRIRQWETIDWRREYEATRDATSLAWDDVYHVVIVPAYKEPLAVLAKTLDCLAAQHESQRRMIIVLAMEGAETGCEEKAQALQAQYESCFHRFYFTVHPRGLPGEMQCKSANEAWAARWIKRRLVDELDYDLNAILVTTMDADTLWHRDHFYALTCLFATNPDRHARFWQAPIRYHGNIWDINPLLRIVNAYSTAFELAYLAATWWKPLPMSSYSLSLRLLENSGYWDSDVIADEWHMYIKAFFALDGRVKLERVFLPFVAQAVTGDTLIEALRNRYDQTLRHAWGSKEVGYMIAKMLEHPEIHFPTALRLLVRIAHDILLAGAGWVIMTIGSQLPILLHPDLLGEMAQSGNITFILLQIALAMITILCLFFWIQDVRVRPPRLTKPTLSERFFSIISIPMLTILTLFILAIPTLQAQTRLLIGTPLQFRVSKKT